METAAFSRRGLFPGRALGQTGAGVLRARFWPFLFWAPADDLTLRIREKTEFQADLHSGAGDP